MMMSGRMSIKVPPMYFLVPWPTWTQQTKLTALDGAADDVFGAAVGISGLNVIVGAPGDDIGTTPHQGSAYVFVRSIATPMWFQQAKLTFIDGEENDGFGASVAISGSTAILGLAVDTVGGNFAQGSACVFTCSGTTWSQQARLLAADGSAGDNFGVDVAIAGNTAIVGSASDDVPTQNQSSAYVFVRSGTTWTQQSQLFAANGAVGDEFGTAVSISGENVIVGSRTHDVGTEVNAGAAYIFSRSGTIWTQKKKLFAPDFSFGDLLGFSVAISDGFAIAGAPFDDVGSNSAQGSAYIFASNTPFDFDGDGKSDIGIFRPAGAEWWIQQSSTGSVFAAPFGASTDRLVPGDYSGDGKTDIAIWRPATGEWFILRSEDSSFFGFPFGTNGDVPVPFNLEDGDTQAEPVIFRPSTGTWFIGQFGPSNLTRIVQWGADGDIPVPGDFDLEGRGSIAIYRPSTGQWWIRREVSGTLVVTFGSAADKPVPGDYTGDGKSDVAFWRPSTGEWFILRSENNSFFAFPFGTNGDVPAPGDYDGDGRFDAAVFRPSQGTWFVARILPPAY